MEFDQNEIIVFYQKKGGRRMFSKYRSDQKNEHMKGLYVIANQRGDPKKAFQKKSEE